MKRVAVVGAGWAGLAAAIRTVQRGHSVTLYEMASCPGGRARTIEHHGEKLDNGQHILIGAYVRTLDLMTTVGVDLDAVLARMPLAMVTPDGIGLRLPPGPPLVAFLRGVSAQRGWTLADRLRLLAQAARWAFKGFECRENLTVAQLCSELPTTLQSELIDPLCVAALNTPANEASARVFLRVLKDALFSGPGSADLLIPRRPLSDLLPMPAQAWLLANGAALRSGTRVQALVKVESGWSLDGDVFDDVVLACTAPEAARLAQDIAPEWAHRASSFKYEPIVTVVVDAAGARWPAPMLSLPRGPAQFAFDHGTLSGRAARSTWVISGAQRWVDAGRVVLRESVLAQMEQQFPAGTWATTPVVVAILAERRATFRCTPGLHRPDQQLVPGVVAAGDYVSGPYPATLEGAVRSGESAAWAIAQ